MLIFLMSPVFSKWYKSKNHLSIIIRKKETTPPPSHFNLAFSFQADLNPIRLNKTFYSIYNLWGDEYWILVYMSSFIYILGTADSFCS